MTDRHFMQEAYAEALSAYDDGEYPVGAVIVRNSEIVSRAHNAQDSEYDPTAHAEVLAIRLACRKLKRIKLEDCTLYTTLYPCPMCEGAMIEAGIKRVVYGGSPFPWIREVKFGRAELELVGPIDEGCRDLFEKRLRENGRDDILGHEDT